MTKEYSGPDMCSNYVFMHGSVPSVNSVILQLVTSAKEGSYVMLGVCLFVCLSVCRDCLSVCKGDNNFT